MTEQAGARDWQTGLPPLQLTTARWRNRRHRVRDIRGEQSERWSKVLAHKGKYDQFAYGTDTREGTSPSRGDGPTQKAIVCSIWSRLIGADVDDGEAFLATRTGQLISRAQALTTRGEDRFHALIDARGVPEADWPRQGPIAGGDIKSNGFIPFPGSQHYSGDLYELAQHSDGSRGRIVPATPELIAAINADREDHERKARAEGKSASGGNGGNGGGHDGELAGAVLSMVARGLDKEACYAEWLKLAEPRDPGWAFERDDFERHYRGAVRKAGESNMENEQVAQAAEAWLGGNGQVQGQPQAPPVTCAEAEEVYAKWLHDTDPVPTRIVLATYVANGWLSGDPVWVMLVGGSGIGKTERIMPLASMPGVVLASTLTGEAALLSASPKRERAKNATGGVLRQIGGRGLLVIKDFTSVLSMSGDRRAEVVAALREIYDGRWDRHYGADGGQVLTWQGHCGFIAGCTTAIDSAHSVLDAMGTRFLFVRLPDADPGQIGRSALAQVGQEPQMRAELAWVTTRLLGSLGQPHEIHAGVAEWLLPLAAMAARGRSPVMRDRQGEIELVGDQEAPTRLIKQLGQLWKACGMLGLDEAASWEAVRRAGLDSIPKLRRAVITHLGGQQGSWQPTTAVSQAVKHPPRTTRRALEDLAAHGLVERLVDESSNRPAYSWALSAQALTWWNALNP